MAKSKKTTKPIGRPTKYTKALGDRVCELLAEGKSMRTVARVEGMPDKSTMFRWIRKYDVFRDQYTRAKNESADAMGEDALDIADDGSNDFMTITKGDKTYEVENREVTSRSKLRIETRKWLMAKMKPKKYGDKLDLTSDGEKLPTPIYGGKAK